MTIKLGSKERMAPVDGLRAIAVLGVVWWHIWIHTGNPALIIPLPHDASFNLQRLLVLLGNGVNLFFVISGFCFGLALEENFRGPLGAAAVDFFSRRWRRLAPAFYAASLVCALGFLVIDHWFPWRELLANIAFVPLLAPRQTVMLAPSFWSLQTEVEFYVLLPVLAFAWRRRGLDVALAVLMSGSIAWRFLYFENLIDGGKDWNAHFIAHACEFAWGMIVARAWRSQRRLPAALRGAKGIFIGLLVAYVGRAMMSTEAYDFANALWKAPLKVFAEPVMTLGFALIIWNVVSTPSVFSHLLSASPLQAIGRWSYSFYLWHWWPCIAIGHWFRAWLGATLTAQYLALVCALIFLLPLAALSYHWLEAPYLRRSK